MDGRNDKRARTQRAIEGDPNGSLARLQRVMNHKGTSTAALRSILREVLDKAPSVHAVVDAGQARFSAVRQVVQLPLLDGGGETAWEFANPALLVSLLLSESRSLQEVFARALRQHPNASSSPWGIALGFDEHIPGDKLALQNFRKSMNLSFSFIELGIGALCHDPSWFTPIVVRSSVLAAVQGGWSRMLTCFILELLRGAHGFETSGMSCVISGQPTLLYARLKLVMSDGDGLRLALQWNGAAGLKCCFRHFNVLKKTASEASTLRDTQKRRATTRASFKPGHPMSLSERSMSLRRRRDSMALEPSPNHVWTLSRKHSASKQQLMDCWPTPS